jgi:hypothetical protein
VDRAPLVDFCNHHNPRAPPHDRPIRPRRSGDRGRRALARSIVLDLRCSRASQRRLRGTGRGFTGQGLASFRWTDASRAALSSCSRFAATPTRSTRTPLVMRPLHRRLEIPSGRCAPLRDRRCLASLDRSRRGETTAPRSHHAIPTRPCCLRGEVGTRGLTVSLARGRRGLRAALSGPPRRGLERAAPEVPSIDEPVASRSRCAAEASHRSREARTGRTCVTPNPTLPPGFIHRMFPTWG